MSEKQAFKGAIFHMTDNPWEKERARDYYQFHEDGILLVENGRVKKIGPTSEIMPELTPNTRLTDYSGAIIMPGLIDCHIHFAQVNTIASYGEELLGWLRKYIFPGEEAFKDKAFADDAAEFFLDQLAREGTTTVAAYGAIHSQSVDSLFAAAKRRGIRLIAGKPLMDRNGPEGFASYDTPESGYAASRELIEKWHGQGRLAYAVTPRFAPACSPEMSRKAKQLLDEFPDVYCQTHMSENANEVKWALELFPECRDYWDIYAKFGLVGPRTILGHCLRVNESDFINAAKTQTVFCPAPPSNLFLGSGLYRFDLARKHHVRTALATDMGAGDTFSMLKAMNNAYKMARLRHTALSPFEAFYMSSLGNARALRLDDKIGDFTPGKEADFIVLDLNASPLTEYRARFANDLTEKLFIAMILGDDRNIKATYIMGEKAR